jgi:hypothetical protein
MTVQQAKAPCEDGNWQVDAELQTYFMERSLGIAQSKLVEDGFQRMRRREADCANNEVPPAEAWRCLVMKKVLGEVHDFIEVDWRSIRRPVGQDMILPKAVYKASLKGASFDFKEIKTGRGKPVWHLDTPIGSIAMLADMAVLRHCESHGVWGSAHMSWMCMLCRGKNLLFKHRFEATWISILGDVGGCAALGWPATRVEGHGMGGYMPDLAAGGPVAPGGSSF